MKIKPILLCLFLLFLSIPLKADGPEILPLDNLGIPKSLGRVESKFKSPDHKRWIIYIQDVHAQLTAQQNIAAIIDHLSEFHGIQTVGMEGGWSSTSLPKSWSIPSSHRGKQVLAQTLLEQDYITGPVYSALFSKMPITLVGIEDQKTYEENRQAYLNYLQNRNDWLGKLSILARQIEAAKANIYSTTLLDFDKRLTAFRDGKKAEEFIPYALKLAESKEINLSDLQQIQTFLKALEMEKSLDKKKIEAEAKRLITEFKYLHLEFEALLKSGKIPAEKLEFYPQSKTYLDLMQLQENIPHRVLFDQIEEVIKRIKQKIVATSEETELDHRFQAFYTANKIITLKASTADLKTYQLYRAPLATDLEKNGLSQAIENGLSFYAAALKRDQIFFDKITSESRLIGDTAIVTGGFHTEGLTEKLEKAGLSYIVITPNLGENPEPADEKLYEERLGETVNVQALSEVRDRTLTPGFDPGFQRVAETAGQIGVDKRELGAQVFSFQGAAKNGIGSAAVPAQNAGQDLADISDEELRKLLENGLAAESKIVAVTKLSELAAHLNGPDSAKNAFNKAALEAFLRNPNALLIINKDDIDVPEALLGKGRKIRMVQKPIGRLISEEEKKRGPSDSPLGIISNDQVTAGAKTVALKFQDGIFGALPLVLTDPRFSSSAAAQALMERAVAILQEILSSQIASASA